MCGVLFLFGAVVVLSAAVTCAIIFLGPLRPERQLTSPGSQGTQQNDTDVPNEVSISKHKVYTIAMQLHGTVDSL